MNNYNNFSRIASIKEVKHYHMVENALSSDELYSKAVEYAADCLFSYGMDHKKAYNKAYRFCKTHGFTVNALIDWYCIDAY